MRGLSALAALLAVTAHQSLAPESAPSRSLAFTHVNLVDLRTGSLAPESALVVRDGLIAAFGPHREVEIPAGSVTIDGRGRYLMPGLVDFHVHLRDRSELASYLAHGVTTVAHMSGPTGNVPDVIALQQEIATGHVTGPSILTTGRILDGDPPIFPGVSTMVTTPDAGRAAVASQDAQRVDFVKVYNNLDPDVHGAIVDEAHRRELSVIGHVPRRRGRGDALQTAIAAGQDVIAHGEELFFTALYGDTDERLARGEPPAPDLAKLPAVVRSLRDARATVVPNLSFVRQTLRQVVGGYAALDDPESRWLHPAVAAMWRAQNPASRPDVDRFALRERGKYALMRDHLVRALQADGVPLLAGTDASAPGLFPGLSMHVELQELVGAGLSPLEALRTATIQPAAFMQQRVRYSPRLGSASSWRRKPTCCCSKPTPSTTSATSLV